jgi:hypothetical protein
MYANRYLWVLLQHSDGFLVPGQANITELEKENTGCRYLF